jgi:predicted dehydrogenase
VEALQVEARHFIECIGSGRKPTTDGHAGLRVVKILEAASKSMAQHGQPIEISKSGASA